MANTNKPQSSIRTKILVPVILLGVIAVFTSVASVTGIRKVNSSAETIADQYYASTTALSDIQREIQDVHKSALSHIIATDFNTMIDIVDTIDQQEADLDQMLADYEQYVNEDTQSDYDALVENWEVFRDTIKVLLAYSANSDTTNAYGTANGDLADYGAALEASIQNINDANAEATAEERDQLSTLYTSFFILGVITIIASAVAIFITIFIVLKQVVHPIKRAERELNKIITDIDNRQGDLTKRIPVEQNDEIGALSAGINSFMEKLQHIFRIISTNSEKMDSVVTDVLASVRTSNDSASDLSAVTEELLATMQEVANNASTINGNASAVRDDVTTIAEKTGEITDYSKTMKENADAMEANARSNAKTTEEKVNTILDVLAQAIQDSKSVEQVNSLTDEILSISSQTNLLALNASIEAARAGEAGKGFAVVADEIRVLADNSRATANNIQEINSIVVAAVRNLSENSENLVQYMKESILPQFEEFVQSGVQYQQDATYIENVMADFSAKTVELNRVMMEIAESINTITAAIDEGVNGVNGAADSTQVLVTDMDDISRQMSENSTIAGDLRKETSIFARL